MLVFGTLALVVIAVLMCFAGKSIPAILMIMLTLPLAIIGGIVSMAFGGGILSVASMVGFIPNPVMTDTLQIDQILLEQRFWLR
ncbi:MAG: efflux RND transporter permease subunit [Microcoleus vaginatus WJT46-NPBG5]|nr:efflux RND transporter permease subunit [Microcoleus vaginatus WJT46-NPBG5]